MTAVNNQYNVSPAGSLPSRIAKYQRLRMYQRFVDAFRPGRGDTIIDVGVTSDRDYDHSNYFIAWYPHKDSLTAAGLQDASFLETEYPGVKFVQADGRDLPFPDKSFDYVHSSAVLEHVGSRASQVAFVREMSRIARKGIYLTTPNRWFPVEFHTVLPFLHWLPGPMYRAALRILGKGFFAAEENLNLVGSSDLTQIARDAGLDKFKVDSAALAGWSTNLMLIAGSHETRH